MYHIFVDLEKLLKILDRGKDKTILQNCDDDRKHFKVPKTFSSIFVFLLFYSRLCLASRSTVFLRLVASFS